MSILLSIKLSFLRSIKASVFRWMTLPCLKNSSPIKLKLNKRKFSIRKNRIKTIKKMRRVMLKKLLFQNRLNKEFDVNKLRGTNWFTLSNMDWEISVLKISLQFQAYTTSAKLISNTLWLRRHYLSVISRYKKSKALFELKIATNFVYALNLKFTSAPCSRWRRTIQENLCIT